MHISTAQTARSGFVFMIDTLEADLQSYANIYDFAKTEKDFANTNAPLGAIMKSNKIF